MDRGPLVAGNADRVVAARGLVLWGLVPRSGDRVASVPPVWVGYCAGVG